MGWVLGALAHDFNKTHTEWRPPKTPRSRNEWWVPNIDKDHAIETKSRPMLQIAAQFRPSLSWTINKPNGAKELFPIPNNHPHLKQTLLWGSEVSLHPPWLVYNGGKKPKQHTWNNCTVRLLQHLCYSTFVSDTCCPAKRSTCKTDHLGPPVIVNIRYVKKEIAVLP